MHFPSALSFVPLLAASAAASAIAGDKRDAAPATVKKAAVTSNVLATSFASGGLSVSALTASVPVATAIVTAAANGAPVAGQVVMRAGGTGPGICHQARNGTVVHDTRGTTYGFLCGLDIADQGDLYAEYSVSWATCMNNCMNVYPCSAVSYNQLLGLCYYKNLGAVVNPTLKAMPSYINFAYRFDFLHNPLTFPSSVSAISSVTDGISTTVVSASGTVSIPGATGVATFTDATVSVSSGIALTVKAAWRMQ